jgi:hypothetical protein
MVRSTPKQAAKDERDIFEQGSENAFASQFMPDAPVDAPVAPATGSDPGTSSFSDWWAKDSTQEKFQGVMGSLAATFTGMAGIPLGGSDMSSMERAGVRAAQAPGQARQMIREKQFNRYIDSEMANATDPRRQDMLQAIRLDPAGAGKYLAMESPASKQERAESLETVKHDYKMAEIALQNEGRLASARVSGGVTPNRKDDILTINEMYDNLPEKEQRRLRENGEVPWSWMEIPGAENLIPHLFSPNGGILHGNRKDPELPPPLKLGDGGDGEDEETFGLLDWIANKWESMTEGSRRFWSAWMDHEEAKMSPEEKAARKEAGLE